MLGPSLAVRHIVPDMSTFFSNAVPVITAVVFSLGVQ